MRIFDFYILKHKHNWKKVLLAEGGNPVDGYMIKVGDKCMNEGCKEGSYRSVYYIYCKNKPEVSNVD